jgi:nitroimidazol reductase NimA-like FMN-containing flavoprotein (pyridoxamine 5'-phosphate oxidase superfamily)
VNDDLRSTPRTRVRRRAERARYDVVTIHAILDAAHLAHVGFVVEGAPRVLPMAYGRVDDALYLHGAAGNALLQAIDGADVCVTVTVLDGLVLARAAFKHSMNYRSVVLLGVAQRVVDDDEKRVAFDAVVDHAVPGRSRVARRATRSEVRATSVVRVPIHEGSAKVRRGGPNDEDADLALGVWAGHVPLRLVAGDPVPVDAAAAALPPPLVSR